MKQSATSRFVLLKFTLFHLLIFWWSSTSAYSDSARVSLLTCAPGNALYSKFGHSAIRVFEPESGVDIVYNYGLFDFDTPNFYLKFIRGKLLYQLGVQPFGEFLWEYQYEGREVLETPLNLSPDTRSALLAFLENNYRPENREYPYDFFYDNCASRIRDVLEKSAAMAYRPADTVREEKTFRELLDEYISAFPWINFGIDLILGLPTDQRADFRDEMFLPDYLAKNLEAGDSGSEPITGKAYPLLADQRNGPIQKPLITPFVFFSLIFLVFAGITWKGPAWLKNSSDILLFLSLGLAGSLLAFMWAGTDHEATHRNMNLLWANPLAFGVLAGIFAPGQRFWIRLFLPGLLLAIVGFPFLPQILHPAVLPIAGTALLRGSDQLGILSQWRERLFGKSTSANV